jgi:hypothetical protein
MLATAGRAPPGRPGLAYAPGPVQSSNKVPVSSSAAGVAAEGDAPRLPPGGACEAGGRVGVTHPRPPGAVHAWGAHPSESGPAEDNLRSWEAGSRDDAVREAAAAGLSVARIQQVTGLAATTIMRILNRRPKPRP